MQSPEHDEANLSCPKPPQWRRKGSQAFIGFIKFSLRLILGVGRLQVRRFIRSVDALLLIPRVPRPSFGQLGHG